MLANVLTVIQILQHLQAQATEVMEDLTKNMFQLGLRGQKDAIAMKIITVATLIYLPATFVSVYTILLFLVSYRRSLTSHRPSSARTWSNIKIRTAAASRL
jgi:hypothetical protein